MVERCTSFGVSFRSMLPSLEEGGTEGVMKFVKGVNDELRYIMSCTGFSKVEYIDDTCLVR